MPQSPLTTTRPGADQKEKTKPKESPDHGFLVIGWNDPVNLMDYVTHVLQMVFHWPKAKAETHMLEIHNKGRSILSRETFERAEHYTHQLQAYGLHATMEKDE
jgi:ATP-dependent Clp protease adaptor protein ClpS